MSQSFAGSTLESPLPPGLPPDQAFAFHCSIDPELWRTTLPLIVRLRCGRHKGLIATWLAIHWLIILYSTGEGAVFGIREIAEEAGVGRNELAGPNGHIQRLLSLGLIQIVGYKPLKRGLRPCPIYHIDLANLERQSIEAIQELLRTRGLPAPPRPAPDPRQLALFNEAADAARTSSAAAPTCDDTIRRGSPEETAPGQRLDRAPRDTTHVAGTMSAPAQRQSTGWMTMPDIGIGDYCPGSGRMPETGTVMELRVGANPGIGTVTPETGTDPHAARPAMPAIRTVIAPDRDIDREKERKSEGEHTRAPDSLVDLATAAARTALLELIQRLPLHDIGAAGLPSPIPAPPDGESPLPAPVLDLWGADRPAILQRDRFQLEQLAAMTDRATGGHGAYWLGRAILMAETCLEPRGQRPTVAYLRALLRRWQREDSWGSDLAEDEGGPLPASSRSSPPLPAPALAGVDAAHPAIQVYQTTFGRIPNAVQAQQIAEAVIDLAAWQRVLTEWQANGWKEGGVAKMIDRYRKETAAPDTTPMPSVVVIHRYPGLSDQQRDRWIGRFHAATTPAEKRAVIKRLEQEHPR